MPCLGPLAGVSLLLASFLSLPGCGQTPRIVSDYVPSGSLRLGEVVLLATETEIRDLKPVHDLLLADGVSDTEIRDGSVAMVRIYCCGGPNELGTARMLYIPPTVQVDVGDIVEYRVGRPAEGTEPAKLNVVTQIRQKAGPGGAIRWVPEDDRMWTRVLYADWMQSEGWVAQIGLYKAFYKPAR